ncbi:Brp/Blh family beta-carotene 15,15'-dioxygenase [Terriglobus sp.]|uniref:Brp/Blh family beta-carotene 15,15'-dioxygenase n=1 Tax=Terriglobus sp. TaxID=1889013 RepID=UPI003AFFDAF1
MSQTNAQSVHLYENGRLLVFGCAALAAAVLYRALPDSRGMQVMAMIAIAIAIWHGAFDDVLAVQVLKPRYGTGWKPYFYGGYVALAGGVGLVWWKAPLVMLNLFLLYSALHFGTEMEQQVSVRTMAFGSAAGLVPIAAACHWWPMQVSSIFETMLHQQQVYAWPLTEIIGGALWPLLLVVSVGMLHESFRQRIRSVLLVGVQLFLFRFCSPVLAFALYFCAWHTPEHMVSTSLDVTGRFQWSRLREHLRRGVYAWLVSLAALAFLCWWARHSLSTIAGLIFVALSALTVPHMVLAEICRRHTETAGHNTRATVFPVQKATYS